MRRLRFGLLALYFCCLTFRFQQTPSPALASI
jgi:hypothetical protein